MSLRPLDNLKPATPAAVKGDANSGFCLMNEQNAAAILNISYRTLQQYRLDGNGPAYVKITERRIGYTLASLQAWAENRTCRSTSDGGAIK